MSDKEYSFFEHLDELRRRIIICAITLFVVSILAFYFLTPEIIKLLKRSGTTLIAISPQETLSTYIKLSFVLGIFISSPMLLYQTWAFVAPGLFPKERRVLLPVVIISFLLFVVGVVFGYTCVLPVILKFLGSFGGGEITPMFSVERYVSFSSWFLLAFGVIFQLPLVILMLVKMGFITPKALSRNRKYVLVCIFIAAAIVTPGHDIMTQILVAVPLLGLYEISVLFSRFIKRR